MRIVVAEDNADARLMITDLLNSKSHEVFSAENGEIALKLVREHSPEIVITDILMPEMDGFTLCRMIKSDPVLASIAVVFYSATFVATKDEDLAYDMGVSRFIRKTTEPDEFLQIIDEVIQDVQEGNIAVSDKREQPDGELVHRHEELLSNKLMKKIAELERAHQALDNLIGNLPGVVFRCRNDRNWTMLFISEGCRELTGYPPEVFVENRRISIGQMIHQADRERVWHEIQSAITRGEPIQVQCRILHADGTQRWVWAQGKTIRSNAHKEYIEGYVVDITEKHQLEEERTKYIQSQRRSLMQTIQAISSTLEKRDPYTSGHQQRVSLLATAIAFEMSLSSEKIEGIRFGSLIHDIGKISIPAEILNRPGKLTDSEFSLIKTHSEVGYEIIKDIEFPWPIALMVRQHHERIDGSGYPDGLKDDEILIESRVMAVADVVEAITSHRPYRPALGVEVGLKEIERGRALQYDADVVDACLRLFREKGFVFQDHIM